MKFFWIALGIFIFLYIFHSVVDNSNSNAKKQVNNEATDSRIIDYKNEEPQIQIEEKSISVNSCIDTKGYCKGVFVYDNGRYKGEFLDSEPHGKGIFYFSSGEFTGDIYDGEWNQGVKEGYGVYTWSDGTKYKGNWKKDAHHGYGEIEWKKGDKYKGNFDMNKRSGKGIYHYANGDKFDGFYRNGKQNGYGIYYYKNGETLEGNWVDGELIEKDENKKLNILEESKSFSFEKKYFSVYANPYDNREFGWGAGFETKKEADDKAFSECMKISTHKCHYKHSDRAKCFAIATSKSYTNISIGIGDDKNSAEKNAINKCWTKDCFIPLNRGSFCNNGENAVSQNNEYQNKYDNEIKQINSPSKESLDLEKDCKNTKGYCKGFTRINGEEYIGEFIDGLPKGEGVYKYSNGDRYEGNFKGYTMDGYGKYFWVKEDQRYEGYWRDGKRDGKGTHYMANGKKHYSGEWKDDKPNGYGEIWFLEAQGFGGDSYKGYFKNGNLHGKGEYIRKNGEVITGEWVDGKHQGNNFVNNVIRNIGSLLDNLDQEPEIQPSMPSFGR